MVTIVAERCGNLGQRSESATQAVTAHILGRLTPTSDKDDLVAATQVATGLLLRPNATITDGVLAKLRQAVQGLEASMGVTGITNTTSNKRRKRQATIPGATAPVDADSVRFLMNI